MMLHLAVLVNCGSYCGLTAIHGFQRDEFDQKVRIITDSFLVDLLMQFHTHHDTHTCYTFVSHCCLQSELEETISILDSRIPQLKEEIEKRKSEEAPPPEDAIETTAPLYRQLLQSFSEEQAIEDTLYLLGDGLRREVIGIELYLKVRTLVIG